MHFWGLAHLPSLPYCQSPSPVFDGPSSHIWRISLGWGSAPLRSTHRSPDYVEVLKGHAVLRPLYPAPGFNYTPHSWAFGRPHGADSPRQSILQPETWNNKKRNGDSNRWYILRLMRHLCAFRHSRRASYFHMASFLNSAPSPYSERLCAFTNNGRSIYPLYRFALLVALLESIDKWKFCHMPKVFKS